MENNFDTKQERAVLVGLNADCFTKEQTATDATLDELEARTGRKLGALYIIGGGSQDTYLNELTAKISGRQVFTGVVEATATGNLLCQMLATGVFADRREAREAVARSFDVKETIVTI